MSYMFLPLYPRELLSFTIHTMNQLQELKILDEQKYPKKLFPDWIGVVDLKVLVFGLDSWSGVQNNIPYHSNRFVFFIKYLEQSYKRDYTIFYFL